MLGLALHSQDPMPRQKRPGQPTGRCRNQAVFPAAGNRDAHGEGRAIREQRHDGKTPASGQPQCRASAPFRSPMRPGSAILHTRLRNDPTLKQREPKNQEAQIWAELPP